MVATSLIVAFGIVLVIEGFIPAFFPRQWRETFSRLLLFSDGQLRFIGLVAMIAGAVILALADLFS